MDTPVHHPCGRANNTPIHGGPSMGEVFGELQTQKPHGNGVSKHNRARTNPSQRSTKSIFFQLSFQFFHSCTACLGGTPLPSLIAE